MVSSRGFNVWRARRGAFVLTASLSLLVSLVGAVPAHADDPNDNINGYIDCQGGRSSGVCSANVVTNGWAYGIVYLSVQIWENGALVYDRDNACVDTWCSVPNFWKICDGANHYEMSAWVHRTDVNGGNDQYADEFWDLWCECSGADLVDPGPVGAAST